MTENPARVRSEGGAALGPDEHQARLTATMRRAERKAAADAARAKLLADFYSHKCRCGEQATVFVISSVARKAVTRKYCADHAPPL